MNILKTIEDNASEFVSQVAVPAAERMRETADELIEKLGAESRELSKEVGTRVSTQIEHLPAKTLKRFNLVTASTSRRRTFFGVLAGFALGAMLVKLFTGEDGERRRHAIKEKLGMAGPQPAAAVTGDLPR
jgi:hypothetical protein